MSLMVDAGFVVLLQPLASLTGTTTRPAYGRSRDLLDAIYASQSQALPTSGLLSSLPKLAIQDQAAGYPAGAGDSAPNRTDTARCFGGSGVSQHLPS